jgi:ankyrin repeat protein
MTRAGLHYTSQHDPERQLCDVQLLISYGAIINAQCGKMWTPLHLASASGHFDVAKLLIQRVAYVETRDDTRKLRCTRRRRMDNSKPRVLIVKCGSNTDSKDSNGYAPLHIAAQNGYLDVVKLLVDSGTDVNTRNGFENMLLDVAFGTGKREVVKFLAERMGVGDMYRLASTDVTRPGSETQTADSDVAKASPSRDESATPLDASEEGDLDVVLSLLSHGANVNERDSLKYRQTPLHLASSEGRFEVAKLLIQHNTDVNSRNKIALGGHRCTWRHLEVARLLLRRCERKGSGPLESTTSRIIQR